MDRFSTGCNEAVIGTTEFGSRVTDLPRWGTNSMKRATV